MLRPRCPPPRELFSADPWQVGVVCFNAELADQFVGQAETMFSLSNGYLGMRGMMEEGHACERGGLVPQRPLRVWSALLRRNALADSPRGEQSMLNCPDGTALKLSIDDEHFILPNGPAMPVSKYEVLFLRPPSKRLAEGV